MTRLKCNRLVSKPEPMSSSTSHSKLKTCWRLFVDYRRFTRWNLLPRFFDIFDRDPLTRSFRAPGMNPTSSAGVYQGRRSGPSSSDGPFFMETIICHWSFDISHLPFE